MEFKDFFQKMVLGKTGGPHAFTNKANTANEYQEELAGVLSFTMIRASRKCVQGKEAGILP